MEKEISDRQRRLQRRFSLIMYLLIFAALCFPWIMVGEKRYNLISFAMCLKTEGAESIVARAGLMPDPSCLPEGCRFHTRCPECMKICKTTPPGIYENNGHQIQCHLYAAKNMR